MIPPNLATATLALLELHRRNGDLAWVGDMLLQMERGPLSPSDLDVIERAMEDA